jgi:hypothetical protein
MARSLLTYLLRISKSVQLILTFPVDLTLSSVGLHFTSVTNHLSLRRQTNMNTLKFFFLVLAIFSAAALANEVRDSPLPGLSLLFPSILTSFPRRLGFN